MQARFLSPFADFGFKKIFIVMACRQGMHQSLESQDDREFKNVMNLPFENGRLMAETIAIPKQSLDLIQPNAYVRIPHTPQQPQTRTQP
jgi:hypothetical protein